MVFECTKEQIRNILWPCIPHGVLDVYVVVYHFNIVFRLIDYTAGLAFAPLSGALLTNLYWLVMLMPFLAVSVRRLHDIGKSGWVYFRFLLGTGAMLLIYTGLAFSKITMDLDLMKAIVEILIMAMGIWIIILFVRRGQPHENKWGTSPA